MTAIDQTIPLVPGSDRNQSKTLHQRNWTLRNALTWAWSIPPTGTPSHLDKTPVTYTLYVTAESMNWLYMGTPTTK